MHPLASKAGVNTYPERRAGSSRPVIGRRGRDVTTVSRPPGVLCPQAVARVQRLVDADTRARARVEYRRTTGAGRS